MPTMIKCKCQNCGEWMEVREADRKRGWGKFCSKTCKAQKQERRTGQYKSYKVRERCREEHGFTPVMFSRDGSMYGAGGQGVDRHGNPEFVGCALSIDDHDPNKDL